MEERKAESKSFELPITRHSGELSFPSFSGRNACFFEFLFHHELLSSRHIHLSRQHPQDTLAGKVVYCRSDGRRVGGHLADAVSSALVDDKRECFTPPSVILP